LDKTIGNTRDLEKVYMEGVGYEEAATGFTPPNVPNLFQLNLNKNI